ncbi:hypothetical protein BKE38_11255 [Pseudoroseomonas deserti]|uniref:Methyltransferase type 11 domain-containing protein n=1 Tax=Teichococcus deserti TaxID=1817963 RepID=A0A1V2H532_9PROT|nr:methyltransferase domain-containing protein [Pseudoroseomonas deserti]ONG53967.1 hypothetical protein BKE38_11255 [Pseudoroseomonas deserti]
MADGLLRQRPVNVLYLRDRNHRALQLSVDSLEGPAPLRLNGGFGLRDSRILVTLPPGAAAAPPAALTTGQGRSLNNDIQQRVAAPSCAAAQPAQRLPPALAARLRAIAGADDFTADEWSGRCSLCGWEGLFRRAHRSERETFACQDCRATLRYRGQAETLLTLLGEGRFATLAALADSGGLDGLAIFEPGISGPLRRWLRQAGHYEQSFHDPALPSGTGRDGLTCQDLMGTAFAAERFDLVVTSDILEHVRRPFAAFAEIRRILKPGGRHVWTVPFGGEPPALMRARVDASGAEDRLLLPAVYHGSGGDGLSLVYTDFGRDIGRLLAEQGLPTRAVRHRLEGDRVVAVTFVSTRAALPEEDLAAAPPGGGPG